MPTVIRKEIPVRKTLRTREGTLLYYGLTSTEGERILAFTKAPDRIAMIVEYFSRDGRRWLAGHLVWGNEARLLEAYQLLLSCRVTRMSVDRARLDASIARWNRDPELLEKARASKLLMEDGTLVPTAFPRGYERGEETAALVHIWSAELLGLLLESQHDEPDAVLELALSMTLAQDESGDDEITYQKPTTARADLARLVLTIVGCAAFGPVLLGVFGPWGGILGAVVSIGVWVELGPPLIPGLLPGLAGMLVLGANLMALSVGLRFLAGS